MVIAKIAVIIREDGQIGLFQRGDKPGGSRGMVAPKDVFMASVNEMMKTNPECLLECVAGIPGLGLGEIVAARSTLDRLWAKIRHRGGKEVA